MAWYRVETSSFPRHCEVQTRCLMTNTSGNAVALANKPSESPVLEAYTFLRLTSFSFSGSHHVPVSYGSFGCSAPWGWASPAVFGAGSDQCSPVLGSTILTDNGYAPVDPEFVPSWNSATSVDSAGWTQVVIQGVHENGLLDVSNDHSMVMVNASINDVVESGQFDPARFFWLGGVISDEVAFVRLDYRKMTNSSKLSKL